MSEKHVSAEEIEAAAQAIYESEHDKTVYPWQQAAPSERKIYEMNAEAALEAAARVRKQQNGDRS